MNRETIITLRQVSDLCGVEQAIVREFADFGLYPVVSVDGEEAIELQHLGRVERIISLYRTLGINKEGIDIILDLREEIAVLQGQVAALHNEIEKMKTSQPVDDPETLRELGLLIEIIE